jgi:CubicO group peptidase (beta-lactamase class C family)
VSDDEIDPTAVSQAVRRGHQLREGYAYLQRVIEHVTGQPLAEHTWTNVLEPLGMHSSSYVWTDAFETHAAQGYDIEGKPVVKWRPSEAIAAYSLHTTPSDFARFMIAVMQPGIGDRSRLTESWIEEMLKPHIQVNDLAPWHSDWPHPQIKMYESVSWGLGWGIANANGEDSFWHWGANVPFHAFAAGFRKQRTGIVAMTNSESGRGIWKDLIPESIGGEHPELSWLKDLYEQMPT